MIMIRNLKINTALILFAVFVFRILFVNIGIFHSLNTKQSNNLINDHVSSPIKKRNAIDASGNSGSREFSIIEICEEVSNDEDNLSKTNPLILTQFLYSFFANKDVSLKTNTLFESLSYNLSSRKYLSISSLRI